jgi:hypothetical protein
MWSQTIGGVALITLITLMALVMETTAVLAHGGPPSTHEVLVGSEHVSLVTSHGFFSEDTGWEWICEEATGADLAASATRTPNRWFVGTLTGLRTSAQGCDWAHDPGLEGENILRVFQDVSEPHRVWIATRDAVWVVDGDQEAVLEVEPDLSVRHMGQRADGTLLLVGFDGPEPTALIGAQKIVLPAQTGRIEVLSSDAQGRFYVRFPAGATDRLIRVGEEGAEVLIPKTELIRDIAAIDDNLYVLYGAGVSWSSDDGLTWSDPRGDAITCLRETSDGFYACPPAKGPAALVHAATLDPDPASWVWETVVNFDEVTTNTCAVGTTAGNVCPYLWPVVGEELGAIGGESVASAAGSSSGGRGCATGTLDGASWLLIVLSYLLVAHPGWEPRRRAAPRLTPARPPRPPPVTRHP